ncbi:MAG: amino acid-binding protein [Lachnospiraceae bacterium]|nr:amino acid-binding protein [Lachnospiraceae bacterium]
MFIKQLSVFIENREGRLDDVLAVLKKNDVNIVSLSLADTSDYGLLRLIVSDPKKGRDALKEEGFSAMLTDVLVIKLEHRTGRLQELLAKICNSSINIEYMYALSTGKDDASIVFKTSDLEKAVEVLIKENVGFFTDDDIKEIM